MKSAFSLLALVPLAGVLIAAPDFAGTWIGKTDVPNAGLDESTLVIQKKDSRLHRHLSDTLGYARPRNRAQGGQGRGKRHDLPVSPHRRHALCPPSSPIKDETLTGAWDHPEGDAAEMKLERKK